MTEKTTNSASISRRHLLATASAGAAMLGLTSGVGAQQSPIKIGMSMALTGGLAGGGKASLLGIEIWRDDVNARGGLLGRKVELVVYDDKSSASETPAIYSKLLDVDKVDLLFAPYATVPTAPIMPLAKQRGMLLIGNFSFQVNSKVGHDMWFNNAPWGPADRWAASFLGLSTNPVIVYVASYQRDSAGILRAVNELGIGDNVKIFGGAMVGLQFGAVMENMGSLLNGVVNYNSWLPEKSMYFDGTKEFFETYSKRAVEAKVDPLGYYLAPYGYTSGQLVEQAIKATGSLDQKGLAKYLRENTHKTIVGPITFAADGEWKETATLMAQFRGVVDKNIEQFRTAGKQVILFPDKLKSGDLITPFEVARK